MYTLREKIEEVIFNHNDHVTKSEVDAIMQIIENHIEWTDAKGCAFGHVYSGCGRYEINNHFTLYQRPSNRLSSHNTLDEAKQAAQTHKEGRG